MLASNDTELYNEEMGLNTTSRYRSIRKQKEKGKGKLSASNAVIEAAKRLSIETPNGKDAVKSTRRRSNRSAEDSADLRAKKKPNPRKMLLESESTTINVAKKRQPGKPNDISTQQQQTGSEERYAAAIETTPEDVNQETGTKIALPFADTPVIQRNKEMRKEKGRKGQRRSSLSLRGRRASSLIESGASNGR